MTKMIELANKDIETDILNIFRMFRKVKENGQYEKRNGGYKKKTEIELVEMKNTVSELKHT